jgi:hypothetical protein
MSDVPLTERLIQIERAAHPVCDEEIRELARLMRELAYQVGVNHRTALERSDPRLFDPNTR